MDNKELEGIHSKRRKAVANFLGIKTEHVLVGAVYDNFIVATVRIQYETPKRFLEEFAQQPFAPGDKVIPTSTILPKGGKKEDGLTDNRKRTVEKTEFDLNTRTWWIWLKGKKFPFNPKFFRLASPRA